MPECDIFNFKDVTLTVRKWFFFLKGHLAIQGLWLTAPQCTGLSSIFFCYTDETRIILEQRKEIMKSLRAITFWVMSLHRSSQRLSFIFPYYHYYNYYYYSVSVLAPCTMGEKTTKMEVDVCVPPWTATENQEREQGGRPERKRYQLVANRLAERSKPYSARLTGRKRANRSKDTQIPWTKPPWNRPQCRQTLWPLLVLSLVLPSSGSSSWFK